MNCSRHIFADVAQSVAHLIGSEEVTGSIPVISFYYCLRKCPVYADSGAFFLYISNSILVLLGVTRPFNAASITAAVSDLLLISRT